MRGFVIFAVGLLATVQCASNKCCPDGWFQFQDSCYFFSEANNSSRKNFIDAHVECQIMSADLVKVETSGEDLFIKDLLKRFIGDVVVDLIPGRGGGYYWLGLTDATEETKWVWTSDGTTPSYTGWAQGEPNSYQGTNEDCAAFDFLVGYAWADIPCQSPIFYICEKGLHQ